MALEIAAFAGRSKEGGGRVNVFRRPGLGNDTVAIGGASARSAQFPEGSKYIKMTATAACRVAFGDGTVVATASSEYFSPTDHCVWISGPTHLAVIAA